MAQNQNPAMLREGFGVEGSHKAKNWKCEQRAHLKSAFNKGDLSLWRDFWMRRLNFGGFVSSVLQQVPPSLVSQFFYCPSCHEKCHFTCKCTGYPWWSWCCLGSFRIGRQRPWLMLLFLLVVVFVSFSSKCFRMVSTRNFLFFEHSLVQDNRRLQY